MNSRCIWPALLCIAAVCRLAGADVFLLRTGGEVQGDWTNRDERKPSGTEVVTPQGIRVRLAKSQVQVRVPELKAEQQYQRMAPQHGATVADQWRLADWCRTNNLPHRRKSHLEAILALEPNHVAARRALGYYAFKGQWQTREQYQRSEGYELYRGRWRLVQDIEIQEERAKQRAAESEWVAKLKQLRKELASEKALDALQKFEQLNDPLAVPALRELLTKEMSRRAKIVYLDALQRIQDSAAVQTMLDTALNDADEEVFYETADRLEKLQAETIQQPLLNSLRDKSNVKINRAAYLIGRTGNEQLVSPLIDVLISVHRQVVNNGQDTTSFGSDGSSAIGRGGPTYIDVPVQNRYVLEALVELTGQNFDFDQRAWRRWYNLEKARIFAGSESPDLRRDKSNGDFP